MRLRVQTTQPLPLLKAWYSSADQTLSTIFDLKESICLQLPSLRQSGILPNGIILLLDGFELLNESPLDVVRDGDLVHVKTIASTTHAISETGLRPKKRRKVDNRPSDHSSSSSLKPSSESGSQSDSSSDASDTSSDACDAAYRHPPCARHPSAKHSVDRESPSTQESLINVPHTLVPPGQGKPSTHSRNRRRRLKRKYATQTGPDLEPSSAPLGRTSGANSERLSRLTDTTSQRDVRDVAQENASQTDIDEVRMLSLRNKNKKKNFRQIRSLPPIPKIVFTQSPNATEPLSHCNANQLVPPSEKQERGILPPRLFVTTVDVEDGMWPPYSTRSTAAIDGGRSKSKALSETLQSQDRGDISFEAQVDWQQAERYWDDYSEVHSVRQLNIGALVGWKASEPHDLAFLPVPTPFQELAINPQTLCPEILLILASVLDIIENEVSDLRVVVKRLPRSNAVKTGLAAPEYDSAPAENRDEYEWNEIMALGWRVLPAIPIGPSRE